MNRFHFVGLALGAVLGSLATAVFLRRAVLEPVASPGSITRPAEGAPSSRDNSPEKEGSSELRARIVAALEAHDERQALALLRSLLIGRQVDSPGLAAFLAEILGKTGENSFFRRHFESVFDEAEFLPVLRRTLEQAGISAAVRKMLLRKLSESGIQFPEKHLPY